MNETVNRSGSRTFLHGCMIKKLMRTTSDNSAPFIPIAALLFVTPLIFGLAGCCTCCGPIASPIAASTPTNAPPQTTTTVQDFIPERSTEPSAKDVWAVDSHMQVPGEIQKVSIWLDTKRLRRIITVDRKLKDSLTLIGANDTQIETKEVFESLNDGAHETIYDSHEEGETFVYSQGDQKFEAAKAAIQTSFLVVAGKDNDVYDMRIVTIIVTYLPK